MTLRDHLPPADRVRRALHVAGVATLVVVVVPFVAYAMPQLVGATGSYVVVSDSMNDQPAPVLSAGDVVFVYDTPPERIEAGDVVTYQSGPDQITTHRVVGVRETDDGRGFETKGDANEEADPRLVPADRVVGTVEFSVPYVGHVITFAGTRYGIVALVLVPAALLVVSELVTLVRTVRTGPDEAPPTEDPQSMEEQS